jgi:SAM-dependent methyltransferase
VQGLTTARISEDRDGGYLRSEWALFAADPNRALVAREAVADLSIGRVLDVGCGAGQELRPFLQDQRSLGVGVDVSAESARVGRELYSTERPRDRVVFVRAAAESLPFRSFTFDLVICRLALPYTDNARAIAEMARVLTPGGALLLKFHHARYYTLKIRESVRGRLVKSALHAFRVLVAGGLYHITGSQPRGRITGGETFQTVWLLRRELQRQGLEVHRVLADSVPAAPSLLIRRAPAARARRGAAERARVGVGPHER